MSETPRLDAQMAFLMEADRLKGIDRASRVLGGARAENSAEHSWHLALFALILGEHAAEGVSTDRVIRMLLLHDLVEIDAGDNPIFGEVDHAKAAAEEAAAAERIFGLLPEDQAREMRALWDEFEAAETPDARFAKALDRFQPPNLNLASEGATWVRYGVTLDSFDAQMAPRIGGGAPGLWSWLRPKVAAFFASRR
ncbi:HD domain-containing protein [Salipiger sp.]|uniref:HD domain-containing protein n=1 Tax=Salipiger sp. TaxID=2078585 RepID=UPI003A9824D1